MTDKDYGALTPASAVARAAVLERSGRAGDAVALLEQALLAAPDDPRLLAMAGGILERQGQLGRAAGNYRRLSRIGHRFGTLKEQEMLRRLAAAEPADRQVWRRLAENRQILRLSKEAARLFGRALRLDPDAPDLRWAFVVGQLPRLYKDMTEVEAVRQRYTIELQEFADALVGLPAAVLASAAKRFFIHQPFLLPYQGRNDVALQRLWGRCCLRFAEPVQRTLPPPDPLPREGRKLRIGFVADQLGGHTPWRLFRGWLRYLDTERFDLYLYDMGVADRPPEVDILKRLKGYRRRLSDMGEQARGVLADRLDVLVYLSVGMDGHVSYMASLRLAGVQCVTFGHPQTTGLDTIGVFLTTLTAEPPGAEDAYSERLVRLPNLSLRLDPPAPAHAAASRESLGLGSGDIAYGCLQSLYKYLPCWDHVWPDIAAAVPQARFLFLSDKEAQSTGQFRRRLERAFAARGLEAERHVVMLPRTDPQGFRALLAATDVVLDSIGWSGGITTLDALSVDRPVVCLPTGPMRGRYTAAMLSLLGLDELIAGDVEGYVETAAALGRDPARRFGLSDAIRDRKGRLYDDPAPIAALERFFESVAPQ